MLTVPGILADMSLATWMLPSGCTTFLNPFVPTTQLFTYHIRCLGSKLMFDVQTTKRRCPDSKCRLDSKILNGCWYKIAWRSLLFNLVTCVRRRLEISYYVWLNSASRSSVKSSTGMRTQLDSYSSIGSVRWPYFTACFSSSFDASRWPWIIQQLRTVPPNVLIYVRQLVLVI